MVDIRHRIGVRAAREDVHAALTTAAGVAGWWTREATGDGGAGGRLVLPFRGADDPYVMEVVAAEPAHVRWRVAAGPAEWVGTHVDFRLSTAGDVTVLLFTHEGWAEPVEFLHHCSTKWATFLLSLRELVETGRGRPQPHDLWVDDWG